MPDYVTYVLISVGNKQIQSKQTLCGLMFTCVVFDFGQALK